MSQQILNSIGLVLGIIGVVVLFFYGPPQPTLETGISIGLESANVIDSSGKTVAQHNAEVSARRQLHDRMSKLGLFLVGLGFAFQLWAAWAPAAQCTTGRRSETFPTASASPPSSAASPSADESHSPTLPPAK
jgi:hypothetical protein